jgi:hypothetical protein
MNSHVNRGGKTESVGPLIDLPRREQDADPRSMAPVGSYFSRVLHVLRRGVRVVASRHTRGLRAGRRVDDGRCHGLLLFGWLALPFAIAARRVGRVVALVVPILVTVVLAWAIGRPTGSS